MHGAGSTMDLAGNAEERRGCCPENYKPCNLAGKACSVTGCRPIKSKIPTISCVSKLPPKWREFYFLHVPSSKPCNLVSKAHSVTGCRPIKKQKNKFFYVSQLPTKFVFCMACGFRKFMLDKVGMGMIYCSSSLWRGVRVV